MSFGQTLPTTTSVVDRSTPVGAVRLVIEAIRRGDAATLADSIVLPIRLEAESRQRYGDYLMLSSQLVWMVKEKLGVQLPWAGLPVVRQIDVESLQWKPVPMMPNGKIAGGLERAMGSKDGRMPEVLLLRTNDGWKLDRTNEIAPIIAMEVEDAPWRNAMLRRIIDDLRAGKLKTRDAVLDALVLHPPAAREANVLPDRSTPAGAVAAVQEAIEKGDVETVVGSFVVLGGDPENVIRHAAADAIVSRQLEKKLLAKFGEEQGRRIVKSEGLKRSPIEHWSNVQGWVVDGDVARAADTSKYDVTKRMVRSGGLWRVQVPPLNLAPGPHRQNEQGDPRALARRHVLDHFDEYATPGAVLVALEPEPYKEPATKEYAARQEKEIQEARQHLATQPAANPQEAFFQSFGESARRLSVAIVAKNPTDAAKCYYAEEDDGSYVLAREKRLLATNDLIIAAATEVDAGAEILAREFHLIDCADDLMAFGMMEWKVDGDRATGTLRKGHGIYLWIPSIKRVAGEWKIDVSEETAGKPKDEALRAEIEAGKLSGITGRVRKGEFKTMDQLREALRKAEIKGLAVKFPEAPPQ